MTKIGDELKEIAARIREYLEILQSRDRLYEVLRMEILAVREGILVMSAVTEN